MNWTVFADLFTQVDPPLQAAVNALASGLVSWVGPVLKWGIILYFAARMIGRALGGHSEPISDMESQLIKAAVALYIAANAANYGQYVRNLLLSDLPREIGAVITGATGRVMLTGAAFDDVWNKAFVAGLAVFKNLPWSAAGLGLAFVVVIYWIVAVLATAAGFLVWLKAYIFLAVLIGTGPLFVGLFFFPALRGMFERWLGLVLSNVILQVFSVALLTLLLRTEAQIIAQIAATTGVVSGATNEISQLQMLLGGMVLFVVCGWVGLELPGLAAAIGGGITSDAAGAARWTFGALGNAMGWAAEKFNAGGAALPSPEPAVHAPVRNVPPGPSLSNADPSLSNAAV
jgi:type IV secretory pathway VirB6-like protein